MYELGFVHGEWALSVVGVGSLLSERDERKVHAGSHMLLGLGKYFLLARP